MQVLFRVGGSQTQTLILYPGTQPLVGRELDFSSRPHAGGEGEGSPRCDFIGHLHLRMQYRCTDLSDSASSFMNCCE